MQHSQNSGSMCFVTTCYPCVYVCVCVRAIVLQMQYPLENCIRIFNLLVFMNNQFHVRRLLFKEISSFLAGFSLHVLSNVSLFMWYKTAVCQASAYMTTWSLKKMPLVTFALCLLTESFLLLFSFFVTPWTVAHQAPLFMEFTRQDYWIGLPFPSPGDLPNLGIKPGSPALQTDSLQRSLGATVHGIAKSWTQLSE